MTASKWIKAPLRAVANLIMGQSPDSKYYNDDGHGIAFLQGCGQFGTHHPLATKYCTAPNKIAPEGSILFSVRAPVGEINVADREYCIGRGVSAIVPTKVDSKYLLYALNAMRQTFDRLGQGSTFAAINSAELGNLEIALPSDLRDQQRIAEILSTVDRALEQTRALIAKYQRMKTGLMQDLLTRGIDEQGRLRHPDTHEFKDSRLGRIPVEWQVKCLADIVHSDRPIVYGILMPGTGFTGGIPVIKVKDIYNDEVHTSNLLLTSPEINNAYKRSQVSPGDLLFTIRGTVGRTAFVPDSLYEANITQDTARVSIFEDNPMFVKKYLEVTMPKRFIDLHTVGQAVKGINLEHVRQIPIAIPKKIEQAEIARHLSSHQEITAKLEKQIEKLETLKFGLMQDLLSGRTSVESLLREVATLTP